MQIDNLLQMNDWEIKKFLKIILIIQLSVWGMISLDAVGLNTLILRELIGFIYLAFVPGILLLRILKLHKLGSIETLMYMVGLSIATLMFTGFFVNMVYPFFGISKPISLIPLIITISIVVLVLCILCYLRDKNFSNSSFINVKDILSPPALFLCLIPLLAVLGTCLVNFYQNNILIMILIPILALIAILIGFNKFVTDNLYPLAIFVIAISLLYHSSLITMYLWGRDIHVECHIVNLIMWNSYWDYTIPYNYNAMLSVVMIAPIFSNVCNMSLIWVFKIIYPLIFSLVPIGLYQAFRKQTNNKIAFLSCFLFMSVNTFYLDVLQVARQEIAELFFVLLILIMTNKNMDKMNQSFLFIIFSFSLAVSHYGISYIYMFCLIGAWLILVIAKNPRMQKLINFNSKKRKAEKITDNTTTSFNTKYGAINSNLVFMFIVFALSWYIYISSSILFNGIVYIGNHFTNNIGEIFNSEMVEALHMIGSAYTPLHNITKYLHIIIQFFIAVGMIALLLRRSEMKFEAEYAALSLMFFVVCLVSLIAPYTSTWIGTDRAYHIALFFLAPFFTIGAMVFCKELYRIFKVSWTDQNIEHLLKVISVLLGVFLLLNTGFVYEITKDNPTSISFNTTIKHPRFHFNEKEAYSAQWLTSKARNEYNIFAGDFGRFLIYDFVHDINKVKIFNNETKRVPTNSYIFLDFLNVEEDEIVVLDRIAAGYFRDYPKLSGSLFYNNIIINANKIYDNSGAQVYYR